MSFCVFISIKSNLIFKVFKNLNGFNELPSTHILLNIDSNSLTK